VSKKEAVKKAKEIYTKLEKLAGEHPTFKMETFGFVMAGLHFTMDRLKKKRHVSGQELAKGIRDLAIKEYGPMAHSVLEYWGIRSTKDMGQVVFAMIEAGLLFKNEEDKLSDFENVYNLEEALNHDYWRGLRKKLKFYPILKTSNNHSVKPD